MNHLPPLARPLTSAAALGAALLAAPAVQAEGIVDLGVEGAVAFPAAGRPARSGEAAVTYQLAASRAVWGPLVAGLVAGHQRQTFNAVDVREGTLRTNYFGARIQGVVGPDRWDAKPFAAIDIAYARLRTGGDDVWFKPPFDERSSGGMVFTPEIGIFARAPRINAALRFGIRLQHLATNETLALGDHRTRAITSLGVGLGMYYAF